MQIRVTRRSLSFDGRKLPVYDYYYKIGERDRLDVFFDILVQ